MLAACVSSRGAVFLPGRADTPLYKSEQRAVATNCIGQRYWRHYAPHLRGTTMRFFVSLILLVLQLGPALTQDQWREFRSESDGFSILLPNNPTIASRRIGNTKAIQTNYL